MAIKDVLVLLDARSEAVGPYAVSLASSLGAHLTAAAVVVDPTTSIGLVDTPTAFLSKALEEARAAADDLLAAYAQEAQRAGLTVDVETVQTSVSAGERALAPLARQYDLAVFEQPHPEIPGEREIMIETALFGSGRPVLVVPYIQRPPFRLDNVLVAWDGSAMAARALGDALPLLERARRIEVVTVADDDKAGEFGRGIRRHLSRHGLDAEFRRIAGAKDVAGTLLSHAFDVGSDLMVMGGYGHSRFRELVLGGATRGVLETMTVPVLMSH